MVASPLTFLSLLALSLVFTCQAGISGDPVDSQEVDNSLYYDESSSSFEDEPLPKRNSPSSPQQDKEFEAVINAFVHYYKLYLNNQLNSLQKSIIKSHLVQLGGKLQGILKTNPEFESTVSLLMSKMETTPSSGEHEQKDKEKIRNPFKWGRK
jgi:hypothetical protein